MTGCIATLISGTIPPAGGNCAIYDCTTPPCPPNYFNCAVQVQVLHSDAQNAFTTANYASSMAAGCTFP